MYSKRCMNGLCKTCPEELNCKGVIKVSKYKNRKTVVDGIEFDSKKEANRYQELLLLQKSGIITDLKRQVPYTLVPVFNLNKKRYRSMIYIADFVYKENGKEIVEDTKGYRTEVYKIKKKLMAYIYQIEIREV